MSAEENKPATKGDINRLDVKIDGVEKALGERIDGVEKTLGSRINGLAGELVKTNAKMDRMEERINTRMDAGFDRVMKSLDAFAGKLEIFDRESLTLPKTIDAHGATLKDHERRITTIESSRAS